MSLAAVMQHLQVRLAENWLGRRRTTGERGSADQLAALAKELS